jgi:mannose-6-phosphate isomerase-like protein (cupin superfamily)
MTKDLGDARPWGKYEVLIDEDNYKVKRIFVKPQQRLSLQYHNKRNEVWVIVNGKGIATRGDDLIEIQKGQFIEIPLGAKHRVENTGNVDLIFIEVQNGDYLGEDDIVRLEDDYNRIK